MILLKNPKALILVFCLMFFSMFAPAAWSYTPSQVMSAIQPYMKPSYAINPNSPMEAGYNSAPVYIYKLPTNPAVYVFTSSGAVDCDGQETALCNSDTDDGFYPGTSFEQSDGKSLIASQLPWYVLPVPPNPYFDYSKSNIAGGEAGLVIYNGKMNFGVFGDERGRDSGNSDGKNIGEFSYAMCISLGLSATACNPTTGGVTSGVTYLVFTTPANVVSPIESISAAQTKGNAALTTLMAQLGGTPDSVSTPTFSPSAGTYSGAQTVTLSTTTAGATIHYTTDGTTPTEASATYASPISVSSTKTIKAKAWKSGMTASSIASATYTISTAPQTGSVDVAGFRSSDYGMQDPQAVCQGPGAFSGACTTPASYWVNAAKGMALKFPGSQPGGIYTVGFIQNMGTEMPAELKTDLNGMSSVTFSAAGQQANPEVMLNAFDAAGLKVILAVEPGNANINQLAVKILNKYKQHSSVIGFGVDNEWYKTESGNVKMTTAEATAFRDAVESVNPNYVTVIKHYDSTMLPKGIPRVIYLTDTCNFNSLNEAVADYVSWANTFSGSRVGYQYGYDEFEVGLPDDQKWWGPLGTNGEPAKVITDRIMAARPSTDIYMVFWADFTMKTQFPLNYVPPASSAVSTPTFSPASGTYSSAQTVALSTATAGATIRYTLDGTTPTTSSPAYTAPISVSSTKTIKAGAWKTGMTASSIASATYTISSEPTPTSLTLKPGWNQISSSISEGIDISTIEQYCTILQYKSKKLWSWNAQAQSWENPTKVEPLKGYWIYAAYTCTVPLSGTPATFSTLQLYNGWNKISASGTLSAISGTCSGHIIGNWIWNWDKATEKWVHPTTMQLDKGYWIKVDQDCVMGG